MHFVRNVARGLAIADFNDDGLPDVAISVNRDRPLLLVNETKSENHCLKIRLHGPSARCFGAKVEVVSGDNHQVQWWGADVSFLSQHAPELIFGLRKLDKAATVALRGRMARRLIISLHLPGDSTPSILSDESCGTAHSLAELTMHTTASAHRCLTSSPAVTRCSGTASPCDRPASRSALDASRRTTKPRRCNLRSVRCR